MNGIVERLRAIALDPTFSAVPRGQLAEAASTIEALQARVKVLEEALEKIANEEPYRKGYCQTDIDYAPALSQDEMQKVARQALGDKT